jgi:hypothetical protein
MYQKTNLLWIMVVLLGTFGALANAYPSLSFPSNDGLRDAEYTAELYELLDEAMRDVSSQ